MQVATIGFDSEFQRKYEFCERVSKLLSNVHNEEPCAEVQPSDSVSQHGLSLTLIKSHRSGSSTGSRLSVKIKVAKAEKAIARLKLNQPKKKIELQQKRDAVQPEQEIVEADNEVEQATLRAYILEEDGVEEIVNPGQASEGKSLVAPERASESASLTATTKEEKVSAPVSAAHVPLSPAAPVWIGGPNRSGIPPVKTCNEVPPPEARFQQLLQQQQQEMIQLLHQTFQSVASTIRQGFALPKPELSKFDGTLSAPSRTISRKMRPMRVRSCHSFFNTVLEKLETPSRAVFPWIPHLDTRLQGPSCKTVLGIHTRLPLHI